jgi:hypothetical protein
MAIIHPLMDDKIEIFNFELEEKLDRHSNVEFDGESEDDSPETQNADYEFDSLIILDDPYYDPLNAEQDLQAQTAARFQSTQPNLLHLLIKQ